MSHRRSRLILNGKKTGEAGVRTAVETMREEGQTIDVRVTWEGGDAQRFAAEAVQDGIDRVIAGGGDGTVFEVVNGLFRVTDTPTVAMGVVPLGSANDFATGSGVPIGDPLAALRLAIEGDPTAIDVGRVNDLYFLNAVVIGFGAEVTFATPESLKRAVGGAAYAVTGVLSAMDNPRYPGTLTHGDEQYDDAIVFAAVGNGIQAGGAALTPRARLDDGLLDFMAIPDTGLDRLSQIVDDVKGLATSDPKVMAYRQFDSFEIEAESETPAAVDGEPLMATRFEFESLLRRLPFVLPADTPVLGRVN